jgi:hypothetical protein
MRIIQFKHPAIGGSLGVVLGQDIHNITEQNPSLNSVVAAFQTARAQKKRIAELLQELVDHGPKPSRILYQELQDEGRVLAPVTEESKSHLLVSGTGLTHLGSVQQRDMMHSKEENAGPKTHSRKMFELGLAGGKPGDGMRGTAPEWFYKGDGRILRGPGDSLEIPAFAPDGGEEPEVAGVYMVDNQGIPCRIGFTQGNEWSDHVTENVNYLYLAPSKMRTCAIGPELITDLAFEDIHGRCRVLRKDRVIYDSGPLRTGQANMCHSLANLEDHHFKFPQHRTPGDIHIHFSGTCKLSFPDRQWQYQTGDVVEVAFQGLGDPLRNPVRRWELDEKPVRVEAG